MYILQKKNAGILYFLFCPKTPAFAFPESAGSVVGSICRNGRVFINFGQNRVQPRQRKKISRKKKPQNVRVFWNFRPPPSPPKNADIVRVFCFDATPNLSLSKPPMLSHQDKNAFDPTRCVVSYFFLEHFRTTISCAIFTYFLDSKHKKQPKKGEGKLQRTRLHSNRKTDEG